MYSGTDPTWTAEVLKYNEPTHTPRPRTGFLSKEVVVMACAAAFVILSPVSGATSYSKDHVAMSGEYSQPECIPDELTEFCCRGKHYTITPPLEMEPTVDESGKLLVFEEDSLGMHIVGRTHDELLEEAKEFVAMLWQEYGCANDAELTKRAQLLKARVISRIVVA